jgi:hypothetical protein
VGPRAGLDMVKVTSLGFNLAPRHEGVLGELRYSSTHSFTSALDVEEKNSQPPVGNRTPIIQPVATGYSYGFLCISKLIEITSYTLTH